MTTVVRIDSNAGYDVISGALAPYGDPRAVRADCGCMTQYADLMPYDFVE